MIPVSPLKGDSSMSHGKKITLRRNRISRRILKREKRFRTSSTLAPKKEAEMLLNLLLKEL
jgi:hypothetical protein